MANVVVLDRNAHRSLRVRPSGGDERNFVAVVLGEFAHLVAHYPILLSKEAETGAFYCGAMLGIDTGENLFAGEAGVYRPLNLQRGPFFAAGAELAIDLESPLVGGGERLFTDAGDPTAYLKAIAALFRDLRPGLEHAKAFVATLSALKLIEPVDIDLSFDDGSSRSLEGLYTVSEEGLRRLSDGDALKLFRSGYLELCYLMIASLKQVRVLARRKNDRLIDGGRALAGAFA